MSAWKQMVQCCTYSKYLSSSEADDGQLEFRSEVELLEVDGSEGL
jgi:hypothetical protein